MRNVDDVTAAWREQLAAPRGGRSLRSDALAWRMLDLLPRHLVLTSTLVAAELGCTTRAASNALRVLIRAGVLVEQTSTAGRAPGRPAHLYTSPDLLSLTGSGAAR